MAVGRDDVDPAVVEHELAIYRAQAAESGKPESIQEKMAEGRIQKFYKEVCLTEQVFVKNPDISVGDLAAQVGKELGDTITVVAFDRYVLGETGEATDEAC
jgi:elongation factor Ts